MATSMKQLLSSFARTSTESLVSFRIFFEALLRNKPPSAAFAAISGPFEIPSRQDKKDEFDLNSIFNGLLLAVPRARRTIERRLKRKHAFAGHFEHATPKTNIIPCLECGNFREKGHLCKTCYEKVRKETKQMQEKMGDDLEFNAPHSEVVFLYENETLDSKKGQFVVNMDKTRPTWFPRKLLNKTGS